MIEIDIGPNLSTFGGFVLSWHGFYSFIAVAVAVFLVGRWAPAKGIESDTIYSIAIWAIIGGVVGARLVHVVDNWTNFYSDNPGQIIAIWNGGIGIWGGILGGFLGGAAYALRTGHPVGIISDLTAPALLFVQSIGRVGDVINGEHCAKSGDFFLGFNWTNAASDVRNCEHGVGVPVQPVILYEMVWNMIALAIVWKLRGKLKPDGMLFAVYLALYSVGRFGVSFARDDKVWFASLQEAHVIALMILAITIPLLIYKARPRRGEELALEVPGPAPRPRGTRAQRRRRSR